MNMLAEMTYSDELGMREQLISRSFLMAVMKDFNVKLQSDIENSILGGVETNGNFPITNPAEGGIYIYNGKLYYCIKNGSGNFTEPDEEHFEEMSLTEVFKKFVRYTDIINDLVTGGVKKCLSAEMGVALKQMIDIIGESGGGASLAPVLRGALKNVVFPGLSQEQVLKKDTTVISLNAKVAYEPRVFVDGELVPSENYTLDKKLAIITFKNAYKKDVNLRIEDNFPNLYKYSVDTKTLLQNSKPLIDMLEVGDAVFVKGDTKAWDGGEAVYVIASSSSGDGSIRLSAEHELWANIAPNSNPKVFKDRLDNLKPATIGAQPAGDYLLNNGTGARLTLSNWFASTGATGWFNSTYGGGWFMQDTTWIRAYQNKGIYTGGNIQGAKVYNPVYADYAEWYPRTEDTTSGDIIALDTESENEGYRKAIEGDMPVGVHSNQYAMLIGGEKPNELQELKYGAEAFYKSNIDKFIPVGLVGRLNCKVVGVVKKGDLIVPSNIPGVGRVYDSNKDTSLNVVGIAVENNFNEKVKLVKLHLKK